MKILLAEDSALSRKLALKMIEHCGHDADSAEDGRQAVEKACSCSYDLILMDMFMPGLDGGEAALEIRSKGASTPIVALSGDLIGQDELSRYGITDSILKPLSEGELARVVAAHCKASGHAPAEAGHGQAAPSPAGSQVSQDIFDEKAALEFAGGNSTVLSEMLMLFAGGTGKNIDRLASAISDGDMQKAKSASHLIKGEAKSLGALKVYRTAAEINEAAKSGGAGRCSELLPSLRSDFQEFKDFIGKRG